MVRSVREESRVTSSSQEDIRIREKNWKYRKTAPITAMLAKVEIKWIFDAFFPVADFKDNVKSSGKKRNKKAWWILRAARPARVIKRSCGQKAEMWKQQITAAKVTSKRKASKRPMFSAVQR